MCRFLPVGLCSISITKLTLLYFFSYPKGGIHGKISLTAYVVAALLETGITTEVGPSNKNGPGMGMQCKKLDAAVYKFIHDVSTIALRVFVRKQKLQRP